MLDPTLLRGQLAETAARLQVENEWWARPTWVKLPS